MVSTRVNGINAKDYKVWYDPTTKAVIFQGSLRLNGAEEYMPIVQLLNEVAEGESSLIVLNLQNLQYLNSSGINFLSKFVIGMRKRQEVQMIVQGSQKIPWQGKSLKNLQRLMPKLQLEFH